MGIKHGVLGNVLVTGGAGYVGSHACKVLAQAGYLPITLDDLSTGHSEAARWGPLVIGDIADPYVLRRTIQSFNVSAILHFAASAYVAESCAEPAKYFNNNLVKTIRLLDCAMEAGVNRFVFSSTCATYGVPQEMPIRETHPQNPINAYGESKLSVERVLQWYGRAYGLQWVTLRYFNAAGADPDGEIGESHDEETHLIPLAIEAACNPARSIAVFGSEYPTPDGTAIRDYIHVTDLGVAHKLALEYLASGSESRAFNLGTGRGYSVREVLRATERVSGQNISVREAPARPGDPPVLVADASLAREQLGWSCAHSELSHIIGTAWMWHTRSRTQSKPVAATLAAEV